MSSPIIENWSQYFDFFDSVKVWKIFNHGRFQCIKLDFYSNANLCKYIYIPAKEFTSKKLITNLEKNTIFTKQFKNCKERRKKIDELFRLISELSEINIINVTDKPGLYPRENRMQFLSTDNYPDFIKNSYVGFYYDYNLTFKLLTSFKYEVTINSIESLFMLILRYCAFLLPLNVYGFSVHFPYHIVLSCRNNNPYFFSIAHSYLRMFNKFNPVPEDINMPFKRLEAIIQSHENNVLLINAMTTSNKIRKENLNLLKDVCIQVQQYNICAVMSNSIGDLFNQDEYIELDLSDAEFTDQLTALNLFTELDKHFICNICHSEISTLRSEYQNVFSTYYNDALNHTSSIKAQQTYATIMTIYRFLCKFFTITYCDNMHDKLSNFTLSLLKSESNSSIDNDCVIRSFKNIIESGICSGSITILENRKSNLNLKIQPDSSVIYSDGASLLITSDLFNSLCHKAHLSKSIDAKRILYKNGLLKFEDGLFVSKKIIYPPGQSSYRTNVYILSENLISPEILNNIKSLNQKSLSDIDITHSDNNGVIIGMDKMSESVIWSCNHNRMPNSHMLVTGKSGSGKTTFIIQTISKLAEKNEKIIVFDISDSYINKPNLNDNCEVYETLPINPFYSLEGETKEECCQRIADNLSSVFKLTSSSYYLLINILSELYTTIYIDFSVTRNITNFSSPQTHETSYIDFSNVEKLTELIGKNKSIVPVIQFAKGFIGKRRSWSDLLSGKNISVLSMNKMHLPYEKATEFLLNDLYSFKENNSSEKVFIVVDEIQNMVKSETSAVIKICSQGREKNLGLIAATQSFMSIPRKYKSMFLQSGLSIFFQPEITAVETISKLIHSSCSASQVEILLKKLKIAECLAYGSFENNINEIETDQIIYINTDKNFKKTTLPNIVDEANYIKNDEAESPDAPVNFNISIKQIDEKIEKASTHTTSVSL